MPDSRHSDPNNLYARTFGWDKKHEPVARDYPVIVETIAEKPTLKKKTGVYPVKRQSINNPRVRQVQKLTPELAFAHLQDGWQVSDVAVYYGVTVRKVLSILSNF